MIEADFVVRNVGLLATLAGGAPRLAAAMGDLAAIEDAALASRSGRIVFAGKAADLDATVSLSRDASVLDAEGGAVLPGFVDAHTHLAFAGDRDAEIRARRSVIVPARTSSARSTRAAASAIA